MRFCRTPALLALILFVAPALAEDAAPGKQTAHEFKGTVNGKESSIKYLLYLPKGFDAKKETAWPVLLFLHGSGERGTDIDKVKVHGPPKLVEKGTDLPMIVISPQCPAGQWWDVDLLAGLIESVIKSHKGDKTKVYCTGLSMGGFGTWTLCSKHPALFAAAVPICGGGNPKEVAAMKDIPTWVFHGDKDNAVNVKKSQEMVDALKAAGGAVEFTVYEGVGHDSWTKTYEAPKLWEWLAKQQRKEKKD